jgi:hypothetical protein
MTEDAAFPRTDADKRWPMEQILEALRGLRYGTVTVVVQDGVVVQVDRTEKRRLRGEVTPPLPSGERGRG